MLAGHFLKVNQISANPFKPGCFVSAADDGTVRIWELFDSKWIPRDLRCPPLVDV